MAGSSDLIAAVLILAGGFIIMIQPLGLWVGGLGCALIIGIICLPRSAGWSP